MISVIIIVKNEELNIERCLESVKWADEIIVLDSGSTDQTVKLAQKYTNKIFLTDWPGYGIQKQRALSYASYDWVLSIDADEVVSAALQQEIIHTVASNEADACQIPNRMVFYNKILRHSCCSHTKIRLFKKEGAYFSPDLVHEKVILPKNSRVKQLQAHMLHYSFRDLTHMIYKMNRYASYTAQMRITEKKGMSLTKSFLKAGWMFFRCYIIQLGFMDGKAGVVLATLNAQGSLYRGLKQLYPDKKVEYIE